MSEFWEEEVAEDQREMWKQALRWGLLFAFLVAVLFFALWWASSAVHFSASRVEATTGATYRITGIVRDQATQSPIPWAEIADEPSARPPVFHATADRFGAYELLTIAEPHAIIVTALGYRPAHVRIGRPWYMWMPEGSEKLDVPLTRE